MGDQEDRDAEALAKARARARASETDRQKGAWRVPLAIFVGVVVIGLALAELTYRDEMTEPRRHLPVAYPYGTMGTKPSQVVKGPVKDTRRQCELWLTAWEMGIRTRRDLSPAEWDPDTECVPL